MHNNISSLIEHAITAAEVKAGRRVQRLVKQNLPPALFAAQIKETSSRPPRWTPTEDEFLKKNLGWMSDHEMADALGRTREAVHLRWSRDLRLTAPSKHPDFLTAEQAAILLDVENHAMSHWCDSGLIPFRNMAGSRKMRLIYRITFYRWVTTPANWIYFDYKKILDIRLRRLCELRAKRWGDEWLSTPQVAKLHNVSTTDVKRLIRRGELPATQVAVSKSGRHKNPKWLNWYVKRSDAEKAVFVCGRGRAKQIGWQPTKRAVSWMKTAWRRGMNYTQICRSMGSPVTPWSLRQYMVNQLKISLPNRSLNS